MKRRILGIVMAVGLAAGVFGTNHAAYAYVGQYAYDNTDPQSTGCYSDAYTPSGYTFYYFSAAGWYGTVELRWSPSCQTAWTRFTCVHGDPAFNQCYAYTLRIYRAIPDNGVIDHWFGDGLPAGSGLHTWTNQLNDAGSFRSQSCMWDGSAANMKCGSLW